MNTPQGDNGAAEQAGASALRRLIMGFRATQMLYVAARLGLADHLRHGVQTPELLARAIGADAQALRRLLRALASMGIFAEEANGSFALTPLAEHLRSDAPQPLRGLALLYGEEWLWRAYGQMLYSVQTGRPAFEHTHGQPLFDYLSDHPAAAAQFDEAMSGYSALEAAAILAAYNFSAVSRVVDVGGGQGSLLSAILRAHPHLSGVVFDRPTVVPGARRRLDEAGVGARSECVAGDFFAALPDGGDIYLLKSVLHDWGDEDAVRILRTCRRAMGERARLLVIERMVPEGNAPAEAKLFDINMLVVLGGKERTEGEYRSLFEAGGFQLTRVIATQSPLSLIEGVRL
jgi:hypothetical protein